MVVAVANYTAPKQSSELPLVLFEENRDNAGNKDIAGFKIGNVKDVCARHNIAVEALKVSTILKALDSETSDICEKVAIDTAMRLVDRHQLDLVQQ